LPVPATHNQETVDFFRGLPAPEDLSRRQVSALRAEPSASPDRMIAVPNDAQGGNPSKSDGAASLAPLNAKPAKKDGSVILPLATALDPGRGPVHLSIADRQVSDTVLPAQDSPRPDLARRTMADAAPEKEPSHDQGRPRPHLTSSVEPSSRSATGTASPWIGGDDTLRPGAVPQLPAIDLNRVSDQPPAPTLVAIGTLAGDARAPGMPAVGAAQAGLARHIATQIALSVRPREDSQTDIALSPEELGRVRLRINATEHSVSVHIVAERGETADLMRRHIDTLAQDLRDLGYRNIGFSFGDRGGQMHQNLPDAENAAQPPAADPAANAVDSTMLQPKSGQMATSGLDLRL
jgi:hypothetical protein